MAAKRFSGFNLFNVVFLTVFTLVVFYPFYYMLIYSLSVGKSAGTGIYLWPRNFTLENYQVLLKSPYILNAYFITIARTVVGVVTSVACTGIWAYAMADPKLIGRKIYTIAATVPMFFSGGIIPFYILIRQLHLINTFWVYILPVVYVTWHMILMRAFYQNLHPSLEESARIDGASDFKIFTSIIFPISLPMISTIALFTAVGQWNAWFDAFIFINNPDLHPIQLFLKQVIQQNTQMKSLMSSLAGAGVDAETLKRYENIQVTNESLKAAATVITIGPIIAVYPFMQKYFIQGLTLGSVKG